MRIKKFTVVLSFVALIVGSSFYSFRYKTKIIASSHSTEEIVNRMLSAISRLKTARYKLEIAERVDGEIMRKTSDIKLNVSPRKLYVKLTKKEVLWLHGENDGNALVNPGAFPYVSLDLDPFGSIMRKNQHHTVHELGFSYIHSIINSYKSRYKNSFDKYFFITGEEVFDGRECYKMTVLVPDFAWENYEVLKGENLVTIARKLNISEFMVMEKNPEVEDYDDVDEGQIIKVPTAYAKYTKILIDKQKLLPIYIVMVDDKGLFESYKYLNVKSNMPIAPEEFTRDYPDYDF